MNQQPLQFAHYGPGYQRWLILLVALLVWPAMAQDRVGFSRVRTVRFDSQIFAGGGLVPGARDDQRVIAWGNEVTSIRLAGGKPTAISGARGFGAGGCLVDVNSDGEMDQVLFEKGQPGAAGRMVWLEAPDGALHAVDTDAEFGDCLGTNIAGKNGVLLLHRYSQLRFYQIPEDPYAKWAYQELYSIYTPSAQGGLIRFDVNGNGLPDLLAGNYWFQAPPSPDKPWHISAINKWWEDANTAKLRLALVPHTDSRFPSLLAAEATASPARVALFDRPDDPKELWTESPIEAIPAIGKPEALAAADLNGDKMTDLVIGENVGEGSRLLVYWGLSPGKYQGTRIDVTRGLIAVWAVDFDDDGRIDLVGLGPSTLYLWRNEALRPRR